MRQPILAVAAVLAASTACHKKMTCSIAAERVDSMVEEIRPAQGWPADQSSESGTLKSNPQLSADVARAKEQAFRLVIQYNLYAMQKRRGLTDQSAEDLDQALQRYPATVLDDPLAQTAWTNAAKAELKQCLEHPQAQ